MLTLLGLTPQAKYLSRLRRFKIGILVILGLTPQAKNLLRLRRSDTLATRGG